VKIIIVGAGPVGCYTAQLLKKSGINPILIEEHKEIGRPVHCAGVVGGELFKESKIDLPLKNFIKSQLDGAKIFYGKESFKLKRKAVAYVIDREAFDKALGIGLDVKYETKFLGFEKTKNKCVVQTDKGEFEADIMIGADGATSKVREAAGLNNGIRYFSGVQFRIKEKLQDNNFVKVYIKKPFFSWIVPEDDSFVRAGIISGNAFSDLNNFLEEIKLKGEIIDKFGGIIPVGTCQTVKDNLALVGDAACQVKPLSHGGLFYGMRGAEILAGCIVKNKLQDYDRIWKKKYGGEIKVALYFKNLYENLSEKDLSVIFDIMRASAKKIERMGDFENHSSILIEIIKDKEIQNKLGSVLWTMLKSNLLESSAVICQDKK